MLLQSGFRVVNHMLRNLPKGNGECHKDENASNEDSLVALLEAILDSTHHQDRQEDDDDNSVHGHHHWADPVAPFSEKAEERFKAHICLIW